MNNDMGCSMMMFGAAVRFGIAYKASQQGFRIYSRTQFHNFKVAIDVNNFEGSKGINLDSMDAYALATKTKVSIYENK